jgi:hypothetical protein
LHPRFVCCCSGCRPRRYGASSHPMVASSGFRLALDMLHWVKPNVSLQRLTWPSKWPATEGHLYAAAAYIAWHNCS